MEKKAKEIFLILFVLMLGLIPAKMTAQVICDISIDTQMPVCPGIYFELSVFEEEHLTFEWQEQSGPSWITVGNESVLGISLEDTATFRVIVIDTIALDTCTSDLFGVSVRPIINIEFEQLQLTCTNGDNANGNSAKVRAIASGAFDPDEYHYFWDIPPLQIAPGDSTLALNLKAHQLYSITVIDDYGCPKTEEFWTEAFDNPEVEIYADPDTAYIQNPFVTYSYVNLSVDSIPITNHFWWFSDTIPDPDYQNTSDLAEPTYEYGSVGDYFVILTVYNPEGCDTTFTKFLSVKPVELFIPNVFTPGTGDETNEYFEILTEEDRKNQTSSTEGLLQKYYLSSRLVVFNRGGSTVFKSDDYNNRWNGDDLPDGVYYYVLECVGAKSTDIFKGSVTIIRGN